MAGLTEGVGIPQISVKGIKKILRPAVAPTGMTGCGIAVIPSGGEAEAEESFCYKVYFSASSTITGASGAFLAMEAMPFLALALAL